MSSTIKLKKSSIAGRVPSASDLEYGEIAINIADGKLYFKNSSNIIQSFEAGSFVDSAAVLSLIDSSHIQARQIDEGLDSAEVNTLIAGGLQNAFSRILVDGQFDVVADSTQDGLSFDAGHNITITTVPNDDTITFSTSAIGADSVTSLIDSTFVQARQDYAYASLTGAPTSLSPDGVDSSATIALIDSAYVQARQSASSAFDSSSAIDLIDSAYVQARQATVDLTNYRTVTQIESMIDSNVNAVIDAAPGALNTLNELAAALGDDANFSTTITNQIAEKVDSDNVIAIVDSAYVQARQTAVDTSSFLTSTISTNIGPDQDGTRNFGTATNRFNNFYGKNLYLNEHNGGIYIKNGSNGTDRLVLKNNSGQLFAYIQKILPLDGNDVQVEPNVASGGAFDVNNARIKNVGTPTQNTDAATKSYVDTNTFSGNYNDLTSQPTLFDGAYSSLTGAPNVLDSAQVTAVAAEAGYTTYDSSNTLSLIDSAYVALHSAIGKGDIDFGSNKITYSNVYSTESDLPSASTYHGMFAHVHGTGAGYFAHAGSWIRLANQSEIFDGAYSSLTGVPTTFAPIGVDSSATIALIDSAYVQARQTSGGGGGGTVDSADIIAIVDSAYIQARQAGTSISSLDRSVFTFTATSNQTVFTGTAGSGGTLSFNDEVDVYINGILLDPTDYTLSGGDTVTLTSGTLAGNILTVIDYGATALTLPSQRTYEYTAIAGQTTFSGSDDNSNTLSYDTDKLNVYVNGILLAAEDFTATSGTSIVLTTAASVNDIVQVVAWAATAVGTLDSSEVTNLIDSAYVQARQSASSAFDSNDAIALIDSAYVQARQTTVDFSAIDQHILPETDDTYDLGSTTHRFRDLYLGPGSLYVNNKKVIEDDAGTITVKTDSDQNLSIKTLGTGQTTLQSAAGLNLTATGSADITLTTASGQIELNGDITVNSANSFNSSNSDPINFGDVIDMNSNKIVNVTDPTSAQDAATKSYVDTEISGIDLSDYRTVTQINALIDSSINDLIDAAPGALNTLNELAAALGDDANFSTTVTNSIATKIDSAQAVGIVDSAYVQARQTAQDFAYGSLTGVPSTFAPSGVDSAATIALIDSAYVLARAPAQDFLDSSEAIAIIDSAYVQARQNTTTSLAFSAITSTPTTIAGYGITDAFDGAYSSLTGVPSTFAPVGVDSSATTSLIDSSYVAARTGNNSLTVNFRPDRKYARLTMSSNQTGITSSEALTTFNTRDVDTSPNNALTSTLADGKFIIPAGVTKVQLRAAVKTSSVSDQVTIDIRKNGAQTTGSTNLDISSSGRDHAAGYTGIIDVVENDYFQIFMFSQYSRTAEQDEYSWFEIEVIEGSMLNTAVASTIELSNLSNVDSAAPADGQALVWDSANNYWKPGTVASGTDSAAIVSLIDSDYIQARQATVLSGATTITTTTYTADSGDTSFAASYTIGKINVYLNGILLVDSDDYTASNGSSVILTSAADSADVIQIVAYTTQIVGTLDSTGVTGLIDSAYVQARQTASSAFDSNNAIGLIDSAYVQARQSTTDLTNYRTVTQIESMIDSNVNAVIDAAPGSLNTLNELAAALGDDANFSTTVTNSIAAKLPLAGGTMTGAIAMGSNKITGLGTPTTTTDAATKAYADTMLPLAGGTMSGNIDLDNNELLNINYLRFKDPGVEEGIGWIGGNGWQIFESPDNMTNTSGNLQFTTGNTTSDRMMTIDTNGNLELPTGRLTQISNDPLRIRSSTNASPVSIEFSDASSSSYSQAGTISYTHSDAASTSAGISGANEVFIIEGTETVTGIKLDGRLLVTGTSEFQDNVDFGSNQITYSNVYSTTSDLPSASTYHGMFAHVHATGKGYFAHGGNWIELANHSQLANSSNWDTAYGWGDHSSAGYLTSAIDSSGVISLIDSSYVQARQSSAGSGSGLDSASTISLIDSAYIQARQTSGGGGTVDSADIIAIVDSDYIQARQSTTGSTTITSGGAFAARTYHYTASANQTAFSGADDNGEILTITDSDANVYLNGILLMRTTDYTVGSNSITLQSGADSDNIISIVSYTGNHLDSNYILSRVSGGATTTTFTATANQTVFSGGGFTYKPDNLTVFYNGILLLDSDDYTATDGTSITLTSGATAGHKLTAVAYTMGNAVNGVDVTTSTFTATDGQTVFNNLDDNGNRLSYNVGNAAIYLNGILLSPADYTANNSTRVVLTEAADSGNILTVMSYAGSQQTTTADSSSWYEVSTTTYNAAATDKLFVDVSSAAATVTLPTSPSMGDEVRVIDATGNAATNNITIGRNGSKINGADSDLTLDIDRAAVGLVYYNAAQGWILMER